jgi:hypothetical protein
MLWKPKEAQKFVKIRAKECFEKVLKEEFLKNLMCKMKNVITRYTNTISLPTTIPHWLFIGLALAGKDIGFRFIIEYSSLRDFGPKVIIIGLFLCEDF